jgi:hypothetical protein
VQKNVLRIGFDVSTENQTFFKPFFQKKEVAPFTVKNQTPASPMRKKACERTPQHLLSIPLLWYVRFTFTLTHKQMAVYNPSMRNVVLGLGISLDGYIARPNGAVDFLFMPSDYSMAPFFATMGRKTLDVALDRLYLGIVPVLLGEGIPLFPSGFPQRDFTLLENKTYSRGRIALTYKRSRPKPKHKS